MGPSQKKPLTGIGFLDSITTKKALLIIFTLGILVFFNGLFNGFVGDDTLQVVDNKLVQNIGNIKYFFFSSTFYNLGNLSGSYYKPVQTLIYSSIYSIFGPTVSAFHFFQILIYITNAALVYLFFSRLLDKKYSLLVSLIFLVHPINSEVAFYISNYQDILFFFFGMLALLTLTSKKINHRFMITGLLLGLSLFSKETGILFLFISVLYVFLFQREKITSFLCVAGSVFAFYLLLRLNAVGLINTTMQVPIARLSLPGRVLNLPEIILFYISKFSLPLHLLSSYNWVYKTPSFYHFLLPLFIDIVFFGVLILFARRLYRLQKRADFKLYSFFGLWFLAGIALHSQLVPLDATVAERWFYFPMVGLLGMLIVVLKGLNISFKILLSLSGIILLLFSIRTFTRSFDWRDDFSLVLQDYKYSKDNYLTESRVGAMLRLQGDLVGARKHAERSVELFPDSNNYYNLGLILINLKEYEEAKKALLNSTKYGDNYLVYENMGSLTLVTGEVEENRILLNQALEKFPKSSKLWLYLAILEYEDGNNEIAIIAITKAYNLSQDSETQNFYLNIMSSQPLNMKVNTSL